MKELSADIIRFIFIVSLAACSSDLGEEAVHSEIELPEHISQLENLTVYSPDIQNVDTVMLVQETVFKGNEDVFLPVYLKDIAIDDHDRVFISGIAMDYGGDDGIYVFHPDGNYLGKVGGTGRGPGEYTSIVDIDIGVDLIYVFDHSQKIAAFFLDDFMLSHEEIIGREKVGQSGELDNMFRVRRFYVINDETKLVHFESRMISKEPTNILFFKLSMDGTVLPGKVLELNHFKYYNPEMRQTSRGIFMAFLMPFSRGSVYAVSDEGLLFTASTEECLIKVYDSDGNYLRAFYYPLRNTPLSVSDVPMDDLQRQYLASSDDVPDTWPVLRTMVIDDEGRLWIATITENENTYRWLVVNQQGELLARFTIPGYRNSGSVQFPPLIAIKNGYFYTRETDEESRFQQIVKHKITFIPQN